MKATLSLTLLRLSTWAMLLVAMELHATVLYVDVNGSTPTSPFTNWATAAATIQDAVDAAAAGDEIVVTNGIYATGGRVVYGTLTNRVVVDKALTIRSVNGPEFTVIQGRQVPGTTNGDGAIRCVMLGGGASLSGFTLTKGATLDSSVDMLGGSGGGVFDGASIMGFGGRGICTLSNCTLTGNAAAYGGGGSAGCVLINCTITGNSGGGAYYYGTLINCTITGNTGDGADGCELTNCTITGNSGWGVSGGFPNSVLNNCTLRSNLSGGASFSTLVGCIVSGNSGAGVKRSQLNNCTVTGNTGGGAWNSQLANCILHLNTPLNSYEFTTFSYCCTTPLAAGVGNFTNTPLFVDQLNGDLRLQSNSPCIDAGSNRYSPGLSDMDGHPRVVSYTVDVGAYEFQAGGLAAPYVHYVAASSTNPIPPYTNWSTAATVIQAALDVAATGGEIVVSDGTYATGGRGNNRVAVERMMSVRSVNGPEFTIIEGYQQPGTTNGGLATRCVSLVNGASLSGFTLTKGATGDSFGNMMEQYGGGVVGGIVSNCILKGNSAAFGGGGAFRSALNNCTLTENSSFYGGGAQESQLNNCTLTRNSAYQGGGIYLGTMNNCTLTGNTARNAGGGSYGATVNNCIVYFNMATNGANYSSGTLNYSCTTPLPSVGIGNLSADPQLASASHLSSSSPCRGAGSIAYATGADIDGEAWSAPPSIGCDEYRVGAVTGPLEVAMTASHTRVAVGFDVEVASQISGRTTSSLWNFGDGTVVSNQPYSAHTWITPGNYAVVLRAYSESWPAGVSATMTVEVVAAEHYVVAGSTNPVPPYASWSTAAADIQSAVDEAAPGSLILVSNGVYSTGGRAVQGTMTNRVAVTKPLTLQSVSGPEFTVIQGYQVPGTTNGDGAIRCVYLTNGACLRGFTLAGGATRTQGDFYREQFGGGLWCESTNASAFGCVIAGNSTYQGGGGAYCGTLNNCTLTGNSAGGGGGAYNAILNNCTLTANKASNGGGAKGGTLNNCTLKGNTARGIGSNGGGASGSTLNNCTLTGNASSFQGGGAAGGTLNNCTLTSNSAEYGGGVSDGPLNNCIVYFNSATKFGGDYVGSVLNYCCTTPLPGGVGNITNAPLFVDFAGGNLRLQSNSPCVNAGNTAYTPGSTDLDGRPRIVGGTVDIGAYEFQPGVNGLFMSWLEQYGLSTDGSADYADTDGDRMNNWQEWRTDSIPTNALSLLKITGLANNSPGLKVTWQSIAGRSYFLERATNLSPLPAFLPLKSNLTGQAGTTTYSDTNAVGAGPFFYRVGVQE